MQNMLEMFNKMCDMLSFAGIDPNDLLDQDPEAVALAKCIPVLGAEQPNWPLAKTVRDFVLLSDDEPRTKQTSDANEALNDDDVDDDFEEPLICWIVFSGNHPYDRSPYAPRDCWNF